MESESEARCEWCGRERAIMPRISTPDETVRMAPFRAEDTWLDTLIDFAVYWFALMFMGSSLISWHFESVYLLATVGVLFIAGFVMARSRAIPSFEDAWDEASIPLMLMLVIFIPAFLVYLGYVAHNILKHPPDRTVIWLLSPLFVALLILVIVTAVAGPDAVPMGVYGEFRGVELLGLSALLLGWSAASWRNIFSR
jgi:hypothetical protein